MQANIDARKRQIRKQGRRNVSVGCSPSEVDVKVLGKLHLILHLSSDLFGFIRREVVRA